MGARAGRRTRPRARGAGRAEGRVDVSLRGVGHRHRDGAARRRAAPTASTEIRHAATEPHVVELCEFLAKMGAGVTGIGSSTHPHRGRAAAARRASTAGRRLHRGRELGGRRRDHRRRDGHRGRARRGHRGGRRGAEADERRVRHARRRVRGQAVASRRPCAASRPDCGRRFPSDLVSLVTVLATQAEGRTLVHDWMYELRLFALEQMSGMGADMFLADAHRIIVTGPTQAARRPRARQPRSALGHVTDRRRPRGRRPDARAAARDRRARLQPARRAAAGARREGREGRSERVSARRTVSAAASAAAPAAAGRIGGGGGVGVAAAGGGARLRLAPAAGRRQRRGRSGSSIGPPPLAFARRPGTAAGRLRSGRARGRCAASASGRCRFPASRVAVCANSRPTTGRSLRPGHAFEHVGARRRESGRPAGSSRRRAAGSPC